ncbi:hypothetical protein EB72_24815 [Mycobacterium sp. SWH-M1]|nr:hypothetical protein EB72_24815 [Mycobacterium sp. SWH-M1]
MPKNEKQPKVDAEIVAELPEKPNTSVENSDIAGVDIEMVEFDFYGETFRIPKDRDEWPTTAIVAMSKMKFAEGVQEVLGPVQWQTLNRILPRYGDFVSQFIPAFGKAQQQCING